MSERKGQEFECPNCGAIAWRPRAWIRAERLFCSRSCRAKMISAPVLTAHKFDRTGLKFPGTGMAMERNPAWKGGATYFRKHGNYKPIKYVRCPSEFLPMARKDGYVMEHRLVVARAMGRCLLRSEVVHHENHDPQDNRLENLALFASNRDHKLYEARGTPDPIWRP